jgi:hypothetical protein
MKRAASILVLVAAALAAQEVRNEVFVRRAGPPGDVLMSAPAPPFGGTVDFIAHEGFTPGQAVKGALYSADAVTESVQTLADGNRITRRNTASMARDSEGRTRRENKMNLIGPWGVEGEPPTIITINDPVAKTHYLLNSRDKTAHKINLPPGPGGRAAMFGVAGRRVMRSHGAPAAGAPAAVAAAPVHAETFEIAIREPLGQGRKPEEQSLGTQVIEGVKAEGTRTVMRIEAGEIGNERPIEVVSERWYSPELQTVVMSKHSDPRFGETTYRLNRIDRREQPPSLFQVPPDYKIVEDQKAEFIHKRPE